MTFKTFATDFFLYEGISKFVQLTKYKVATHMTAIELSAVIELCLAKIYLEK